MGALNHTDPMRQAIADEAVESSGLQWGTDTTYTHKGGMIMMTSISQPSQASRPSHRIDEGLSNAIAPLLHRY
jgi:hypothetical protein